MTAPADTAADTRARAPRRETPMPAVLTLATKEVREGIRNRWVLATTLLLAALALTLASAFNGDSYLLQAPFMVKSKVLRDLLRLTHP